MLKTNAIRLLTRDRQQFETLEYPVEDGRLDAISIAQKTGQPQEQVFKTLVTESPDHGHYVFMIPAAATLDLKKAASAAGVKSVDMIPLKQLFPLTGYVHGGCSPIGMKKDFPVFLDETAILFDAICFSGGHIGLMLLMAPEAIRDYVHGRFCDLTRDE